MPFVPASNVLQLEVRGTLNGIPVEITIGNGRLDTWRILEEVL